jgi:hypothetical protein
LATGIIPSFDTTSLPSLLTDTAVRLFWKHLAIRTPKIAESPACFIGHWNALPEQSARRLAPVSKNKSHNLARPAADGNPQPAFVNFFQDKRPHFIQLQDIIVLSWKQCLF